MTANEDRGLKFVELIKDTELRDGPTLRAGTVGYCTGEESETHVRVQWLSFDPIVAHRHADMRLTTKHAWDAARNAERAADAKADAPLLDDALAAIEARAPTTTERIDTALAAIREKRARERLRWEREAAEWTDAEIAEHITDRFAPVEVPPCRVCGSALSIASAGGGPTVWACGGMEPDPADPERYRYAEGRTPADEHYSRSRWEDRRCGGDPAVMELLRRAETLRAHAAGESERVAAAVAAETERCRAVCDEISSDEGRNGLWRLGAQQCVERIVKAVPR